MKRFILSLYLMLFLAACSQPTPPAAPVEAPAEGAQPQPTLIPDQLGTAEDLVPAPEEIETARAVLGQHGFIGIVTCTMNTEYHATVANSARARADALGLKAALFDSDVQAEQQASAIKNFTAKGAKVIVLCALDPQVVEPAVKEAEAAGVLFVQVSGADLPVKGISIGGEADSNADLGCAAGEIAGDLIATEKAGRATVAILDYPDLPEIIIRADNIEKCMLAKAPQATVVGRFLGGTTENGLKSMITALEQHPAIDVVVSINDAGAYGALTALQAANKDPQTTMIVGIDAEARAKDLIKAGTYYRGTVDTSPAKAGEIVINAAVKLLASATVPQTIRIPVTKVTPENLP
ncbi:MAG: sugar ABC transporter substrate-binding protein [Anaerolineae bacterium]|nr:sugar ABC transporter substrate-binding protein [Anaerolineae bacterium]